TNTGIKKIQGDLIGDESFFRGPELGSGWAWDDTEYYYGAEVSALTIDENTIKVQLQPGERQGALCRVTPVVQLDFLSFSNRSETAKIGGKRTITFYRPLGQNLVYISGQMALGDAPYTEPVAVHRPALLFMSLLRESLARHGITVAGKLRTVNWLDRQVEPADFESMVELGSVQSPPLTDIASDLQKASRNLDTDLLLAHIGEKSRQEQNLPAETSEELGIRTLDSFLREAGIKRGQTVFEEGSGLSRDNLTTPEATVALLQFMSHHDSGQAYLNALPVAGV